MEITNKERLQKSAKEVFQQLAENPFLEIPLDPDLADFIGAFEEDAVMLEDILEHEDNMEGNIYE